MLAPSCSMFTTYPLTGTAAEEFRRKTLPLTSALSSATMNELEGYKLSWLLFISSKCIFFVAFCCLAAFLLFLFQLNCVNANSLFMSGNQSFWSKIRFKFGGRTTWVLPLDKVASPLFGSAALGRSASLSWSTVAMAKRRQLATLTAPRNHCVAVEAQSKASHTPKGTIERSVAKEAGAMEVHCLF